MDLVTTKRTRLHAANDDEDLRFPFTVLTHPDCNAPFKWRGATPPFDEFVAGLFDGILVCTIVRSRRANTRLGVVFLSSADLRDGHAFLTAAAAPTAKRTGLVVESVFGAVEFAFLRRPFHKLYADVDDLALTQFGSAVGKYLEEEGLFREHMHRDGQLVDVHRLALYRSTWERERPRCVGALGIEVADGHQLEGSGVTTRGRVRL